MLSTGAGLTVRVNWPEVVDCAPAALESVTVTVKLNVPVVPAGGVPESTPAALIESQEGRPVALQLSVPEPNMAANVKVNGLPAVAGELLSCAWVVEIVGTGLTMIISGAVF